MSKPCYMLRPEEIRKHGELCRLKGEADDGRGALGIFEKLADGDADLFAAMWSLWNFEHVWDDLIDENDLTDDQKEGAMAALHDQVVKLLTGPALQDIEVKAHLTPEFLGAWNFLKLKAGWSKERLILASTARNEFFAGLICNPFVRRHAAELRGMLVMAMLRCLDGDAMAHSPDLARQALAPAVRCGDVDVIVHMVYLARGWAAARVVSAARDYDIPDQRKEAA